MRGRDETIDGYFYKIDIKQYDSSGDEEEEEPGDFIDTTNIKEVAEGGSYIAASSVKLSLAGLRVKSNGHRFTVHGKFWTTDPWWEVTVTVGQNTKRHKLARGPPAYRLRTDPGVLGENLLSLFLTKCGVEDKHKALFHSFIKDELGQGDMWTFEYLEDILQVFGESKVDGYAGIAEAINLKVKNSWAGMMFHRCEDFPELFEYLPRLLPKKFVRLMDLSTGTLVQLSDALQNEPWIFGFAPIMADKFWLFGCESQLDALKSSGLLDQFPETEKDALYIYSQLKCTCYLFGHTFVFGKKLFQDVIKYQEYNITHKRMKAAFDFLVTNRVIHLSDKCGVVKVYLLKLWDCEQLIVRHFTTLLRRHEEDPFVVELDFDDDGFKDIKSDADQWRAARMISAKPITVMSGRGGCGKTTVVSKVCLPAENQIIDQLDRNYAEQMFEDSEIDDITLSQAVEKAENNNNSDFTTSRNDMSFCSPSSFCKSQDVSVRGRKKKKRKPKTRRQEDLGSDAPDSDLDEEKEGDPRKDYPVVLLTAPTGKAANLLGKRAKLSSFTLHQVIYSYKRWKTECREAEAEGRETSEWKFHRVTVLVVDECSLVSVTTISTMLDMLMCEAKIRKLVLLGDILQLPSIEPGNFLSDTFHAFAPIGCSVLLRTNHRSNCELITENAGKISGQLYPFFDEGRNFIQKRVEGASLTVGPHSSTGDYVQNDQDAIVRTMLHEMKLSPEKCQFVAFRRNDCDSINEICAQHYVKHPLKGIKKKLIFEIGDKVCCTKNANVKNRIDDKTIRLCNGEIFFITDDITVEEDGKKKRYLILHEPDSNTDVKVNFSVLRLECKLRHAWARTIHTYQGSESEIVVYVVGKPVKQTWQHVYTAVTRGRHKVILITSDAALHKAIGTRPIKRQTCLGGDLRKMLAAENIRQTPKRPETPRKTDASKVLPFSVPCTPRLQSAGDGFDKSLNASSLSSTPSLTPVEEDENGTGNSSQAFSDWGESFTAEVTRIEDTSAGKVHPADSKRRNQSNNSSVLETERTEELDILDQPTQLYPDPGSVLDILDQPTQLYREQWNDSDSDEDLILCSQLLNAPPVPTPGDPSPNEASGNQGVLTAGGPRTPKREAASPVPGTPAKHHRLPENTTENTVTVTPVRYQLGNMSTEH